MRIIAGRLKGRRLQAPPPGDLSVRPTSDRGREALFSLLLRAPMGAFLDLFGGTGAVALEAWSRGYGPVTCLEQAPRALAMVQANARFGEVVVRRQDVRRLQEDAFRDLAVVFADPPYEAGLALWVRMAPRIRPWMLPEGILVWETDQRTDLPAAPGWEFLESRAYGTVRFHLFRPA